MDEKEIKTNVDDLEIEPLSDEAIESIAGGTAVIHDPCYVNSCSTAICSSDEHDVRLGGA